jgi:hypothetical protein
MPEPFSVAKAQPGAPRRPGRWAALVAALVLAAGIIAGAIYGKLSANLHGEYFNIARALFAGRGFANPFGASTGPTAWQAPLLPSLQAAVLWMSDGASSAVVRVLVVLHMSVLIGTGFLVVGIAWQTTGGAGAIGAALAFAVGLVCNFRSCFELATDPWLNMLLLDLLIAGLFWLRPLEGSHRAIGWGLFGGLCALANPTTGMVWGMLTVMHALHGRAWRRLAVAVFVAGLALSPWMIRNYLVFGRLIPMKSNLAYELFQAQCLQPPGVLKVTAIGAHPFNANSREGQEYRRLGEPDYMARKWEQYAQAVWADPLDFLDRVASRFLCATLWFDSYNPVQDARRPWLIWLNRCMHPVPSLALLILLFTVIQRHLRAIEWVVVGIYMLYLLPYVAVSYYDRYGLPLLGVKALLVVWAVEQVVGWWPTKPGPRLPA